MSEKSVLIGPTMHASLSDVLWYLRGNVPIKGDKQLNRGDVVWEYRIEDLNELDKSIARQIFRDVFNLNSKVDLSLRAPVTGDYTHSGWQNMFGRSARGAWYTQEEARESNIVPTTLEEFRNGYPTTYSFYAVTSEPRQISGAELYSHFFDGLLSNRALVSEWLRESSYFGNYGEYEEKKHLEHFWDSIQWERDRLKGIMCPILPYVPNTFR